MDHEFYGLHECGLLKGLGREIITNCNDSSNNAHIVTDMSPDDLKDDGTVTHVDSKTTQVRKNRTITKSCQSAQQSD